MTKGFLDGTKINSRGNSKGDLRREFQKEFGRDSNGIGDIIQERLGGTLAMDL